MPKVFLIPINNTPENYLKETIKSILSQTFRNFEFLILNDYLNSLTLNDIVSSFYDKRIQYHKNNKNLGINLFTQSFVYN